ncbi:hypothetical protein [Cupriavidus consociatus]|uniref:hypothetical protein n=1 Tax=Cupriavidus consociatus TaxID=2821357 RepID=UPI001AE49CEE|nr:MULTISPECIES: hypothetical protein [unclassified Cupriavidus]MBP0625339.1 hypothetical protein [Cupriavidus sp. LEh25]MDK2662077.1 hypothetical protein [Cupriavidus sp. LEh21]
MSGYTLDEALPPLSTDIIVHSRSALLIRLARDRGLTFRQLYHLVASARGHQIVVGTADQVADHMIDWVSTQAQPTASTLCRAHFPDAFEDFTREVVPRLQARGAFRADYAGKTLRDHLELPMAP